MVTSALRTSRDINNYLITGKLHGYKYGRPSGIRHIAKTKTEDSATSLESNLMTRATMDSKATVDMPSVTVVRQV